MRYASYHVGIVTMLPSGDLGVVSQSSETDRVRLSGWPFAPGSNKDPYYSEAKWEPVIWRCNCE